MENLEINFDNFELSLDGPEGKERLKIVNDYPNTQLAEFLFSHLGLMHMVAPYLPNKISTNFAVVPAIKELIELMYKAEKRQPPLFQTLGENIRFRLSSPSFNKVVVAYSAGKDSMWNLWWAQEKYGPENVLAVHINGLNRGNASRELEYTKKQQEEIGFQLKVIDLLNSSRNVGDSVTLSRDIFLTGIIVPIALEFGASKIITEGFLEEVEESDDFSVKWDIENFHYFNKTLKSINVPIQIFWRDDHGELDAVKDLIKHRPKWLLNINNCLAIPSYQIAIRKNWEVKTPTLAEVMYDSQCGSCVKCRVITLARILHDPAIKKVKDEDIKNFLENTARWIKEKGDELDEWVEESFYEYFNEAVERHDLSNLKLVVQEQLFAV